MADSPTPTTGKLRDAEVRLHLLGGFRLTHDDTPVVVPRGLQRVIALIGLRPATTRTHLAGLLWPETTEERALSSLRTALWRLRQDPYCPLATNADTVRLDPAVQVDVDKLVDTAGRVRDGQTPADAAQALAAGRHDLLPGWYDEWVLTERERLRQLRLHMLEQVAGHHLVAGRHGEALDAALEAMAAEPLRETPHRLVVRIHLAEGNAFEAVHAFYVYRDLLLRELRLEPSPAMSALLDDTLEPIRRASQAASTSRRYPALRSTQQGG
ncbi:MULTISPECIES: AfsR/SARP family transcriptional regulator [Micromonospora]|uniref:Transcriptional regulator n=1 Tax=Micromonospora maris TaxID=1003110 RepID=A0A9X0LEJ2_9ACTN|nr:MULTISPECIES: BTAD domain-containing putative transcriptional regulator [Micromonospora]AEB45853.1 SARP family transcriptional regulator [Micromonospora maris AB-18-032]KUJ47139.1 transcriptional regulator [Micromonospora maris]RUL94775.1 transcriptional regulator [Verrucosispora sp. FIM060022]WSK41238.1 transcriptional regulator [Micromonospora maris]